MCLIIKGLHVELIPFLVIGEEVVLIGFVEGLGDGDPSGEAEVVLEVNLVVVLVIDPCYLEGVPVEGVLAVVPFVVFNHRVLPLFGIVKDHVVLGEDEGIVERL